MKDRLLYYWNRTRERLWFKPLLVSLLSVGAVFLAHYVDGLDLGDDSDGEEGRQNGRLRQDHHHRAVRLTPHD